ncbi:hypothetical protein COOONC_09744 [Cooperia oncophora]
MKGWYLLLGATVQLDTQPSLPQTEKFLRVCRCRYLHENRRYCRLIQQYGVVPKRCLELFARSLMPYTVSVGYEALLLQSELCFISTDEESEA